MISGLFRKATLRIFGTLGAAVFGFFFVLTYHTPEWVEKFAADFIESEVAKKVDSAVDSVELPNAESALTRFAESVLEKNATQIESLRTSLEEKVHEQMADAIAQIRDLDCECRDQWAEFLEEGFEFNIGILQAANDQVVRFIQAEYVEVVEELKRDIRIFTGVNCAVFLMLLVLSLAKPRAIGHLFLPGLLLVASTLLCSYFYIFEQDWLLTIIYSDYLGFGYLAYLLVVFLFLCDVAFNRGRVTTEVVNAACQAVGSSIQLVPC